MDRSKLVAGEFQGEYVVKDRKTDTVLGVVQKTIQYGKTMWLAFTPGRYEKLSGPHMNGAWRKRRNAVATVAAFHSDWGER